MRGVCESVSRKLSTGNSCFGMVSKFQGKGEKGDSATADGQEEALQCVNLSQR